MAKFSEQELVTLRHRVSNMIAAAKKRSDTWAKCYSLGIDYLYGNQTPYVDIKIESFTAIQAPMVFPAAIQEIALLIQRRASLSVRPLTDTAEDEQAAAVWGARLKWQYERGLRVPVFMNKARLDGKAAGFWVAKIYWEPEAKWDGENRRWRGQVRLTLLKPDQFGVDPEAESLADAEYVYTRRRVSLEYAVGRWPERADDIKAAASAEPNFDEEIGLGEAQVADYVGLDEAAVAGERATPPPAARDSFLSKFVRGESDVAQVPFGKDETDRPTHVTITEIYFRDRSLTTTDTTRLRPIADMEAEGVIVRKPAESGIGWGWYLADSGELLGENNWPSEGERYEEPAYPNGRYVLMAGDTVLNDTDDTQRWPHPQWPFVVGLHYPLPHVWQGLNSVELVRGLQDFRNLAFTHLLNHVQHFSDPNWMVEDGALSSQVPPEKGAIVRELSPRAGGIIRAAQGRAGGISQLKPPTLGEGVPAAIRLAGEEIRNVNGVQEVIQGISSHGAMTATEIMRLETNSKLRVGLQAFYEDAFILEMMQHVLMLEKYYLQPEDMVEVLDDEARQQIEALNPQATASEFDLVLDVVNELPYDLEREKQEANVLYQIIGLPYLPYLLKAYNVRRRTELLNEIPEWVAYQQFKAAQEIVRSQEGAQNAGEAVSGGGGGEAGAGAGARAEGAVAAAS